MLGTEVTPGRLDSSLQFIDIKTLCLEKPSALQPSASQARATNCHGSTAMLQHRFKFCLPGWAAPGATARSPGRIRRGVCAAIAAALQVTNHNHQRLPVRVSQSLNGLARPLGHDSDRKGAAAYWEPDPNADGRFT